MRTLRAMRLPRRLLSGPPRIACLVMLTLAIVGLALLSACAADDPAPAPAPTEHAPLSPPSVTVLPYISPTSTSMPTPIPVIPVTITLDLPNHLLNPTPEPTGWTPHGIRVTPPSSNTVFIAAFAPLLCDPPQGVTAADWPLPDEPYPFWRFGHDAYRLRDGRILMSGGETGVASENVMSWYPLPTMIDSYDPQQAKWCGILLPEDMASEVGSIDSQVELGDGSLLLIVHIHPKDPRDNTTVGAILLDTQTLTFRRLAPPIVQSAYARVALLKDGRVLRVGGVFTDSGPIPISAGDTFASTVAEIYDPATDSWTLAAPIAPEPRISRPTEFASSQWLFPMPDGRALLLRLGTHANLPDTLPNKDVTDTEWLLLLATGAGWSREGRIEIYEPATDSWSTVSAVPAFRGESPDRVVFTSANKVFIFSSDGVSVYDLSTDIWKKYFNPRGVPSEVVVTELPDGRLLISGGSVHVDQQNWRPTTRTEIFDPETRLWAPGPDLAEPRHSHSVTLLPDGSVLLFGGIGMVADIDEIALWNTLELISASQLAAVDTVTVPEHITRAWSSCIATGRVKPLPASSRTIPDLPESPEALLDMARLAMNELRSYASEEIVHPGWRGVPSQMHELEQESPDCIYTQTRYEAPNHISRAHRTLADGRAQEESAEIHIAETRYAQNEFIRDYGTWGAWLVDTWLARESDPSAALSDLPHTVLRGHGSIPLTLVGVEVLDDVDVYHLSVYYNYSGCRRTEFFDYWIGVDDHLLRQFVYRVTSPSAGQVAPFPDHGITKSSSPPCWGETARHDAIDPYVSLIRIHSFNEDFNIQPPENVVSAESIPMAE